MATKTKAPPVLPRTADFEAARKALSAAYNELEAVEHALTTIIKPYMDEGVIHEGPDFAYIGEVYSFCDDVSSECMALGELEAALREELRDLDAMRDAHARVVA